MNCERLPALLYHALRKNSGPTAIAVGSGNVHAHRTMRSAFSRGFT